MEKDFKILVPKSVADIIDTLENAGHESYAVGGCVRDALLNRIPNDWDITTSASPNQIKALFPKTIDTGIEHGTVTVMIDHVGYEVTTYRVDGEYLDGRHPKEVTFTRSLAEDLLRRDFTINAMAYHPKRGLVDLFCGTNDLKNGIIRCVGDATARFGEDALRILRAFRFAAQLGFSIEKDTLAAAALLSENLHLISKERIAVELTKLLTSNHPDYFDMLSDYKITKVLMPDYDRMKENGYKDRTLKMLQNTPADKVYRYVALFHAFGDEQSETSRKILRELKFDNDTIKKVTHLLTYLNYDFSDTTACAIRHGANKIGADFIKPLLICKRARLIAYTEDETILKDGLSNLEEVEKVFDKILSLNECIDLKGLKISGRELILLGCKNGPVIGEILNNLLEIVLTDPKKNNASDLMALASDMIK